MIHIAILVRSYLDLILSGRKTIESRLSKTNRPPYERVETGERIYFKQSSGRFRATARAGEVLCFDKLDPEQIASLRRRCNDQIRGDAAYWDSKRDSNFATLVELRDVERVRFGPTVKPQRGVAWLVLDDALDVYPDCVRGSGRNTAAIELRLTDASIRNRSISVRDALDQFPADAIGGPTKSEAGVPVMLQLDGGSAIATDIAGDKGIFRSRAGWGRWLESKRARSGDCVRLIPRGGRTYDVSLVKSSRAGHGKLKP